MTAALVANVILNFRFPTAIRPPRLGTTCRIRYSSSRASNPIPASFLRGGTSKGVFINRDSLPGDKSEWPRIFLGIMGSPDSEYGRQLNGMGGGISSLSKICVVGKPTAEQISQGIHAEYTFVQVGIRDSVIDVSGNCGNLSTVIGAYAVDEKICQPRIIDGRVTVRSFNTNTQKIIDTTFPATQTNEGVIADLDMPEMAIAGVSGKASQIVMKFIDPAGARTGKLLPTGSARDTLTLPDRNGGNHFAISLVDATNPTVFASYPQLNSVFPVDSYVRHEEPSLTQVGQVLETVRQQAATMMGLDPTVQSQPKIALLSHPTAADLEKGVELVVHALSMGVLHKAVPLTVALCLGVAANTEGTLPWTFRRLVQKLKSHDPNSGLVRMRHPTGIIDVGAEYSDNGLVKSAYVVGTGRKLMKGVVWW